MTKITKAQRELLTQAAADAEGAVDAPADAKISRPLIKQRLAISLPVYGRGSRLVITTAGREQLAADQLGEPDGGEAADGAAERAVAETTDQGPAAEVEEASAAGDEPGDEAAAANPSDKGENADERAVASATVEELQAPESKPGSASPAVAAPPSDKRPHGKLGTLVDLLSRPDGATLEEMVSATGWQTHSVRGAMSGGLKKKLGFTITSAKTDGTRVYRIVSGEAA